MEKGDKVNIFCSTGEIKECKISKAQTAFLNFNVKEEYRFNTVLKCLEKKINGNWVECLDWEKIVFAENSTIENSLWTKDHRELLKIIPFLVNEKAVSILRRIAFNLLDTEEMKRYLNYTSGV